ncbi:hypothetical protein UlMin_009853 [Ulmus minor]
MSRFHGGDYGKVKLVMSILVASFLGFAATKGAGIFYRRRQKTPNPPLLKDETIIPKLERNDSGRVQQLERFSHYVARQLGISDPNECEQLCNLSIEYLKNPKKCEESIFEYFGDGIDVNSLYVSLIEEFQRCMLSYFSFHWSQASVLITQVLNVESEKKTKLKDLVLAATRKQRFERITKNLKVTRFFSTLVEEMKAIRCNSGESESTEVMVPAAHSQRSPVLLLMGGGMGAGKSTVLKDIRNDVFWSGAAEANAVVVEADAFKETDVIYKAISSRGHHHDMLQTAELVHKSSMDAASSVLVTALNEGRDVIMDGTLSWAPFVEQTIAMARNVHKCRYRMGVGYKVSEDDTITENYWEQVDEKEEGEENGSKRKRAIMVRRAVRVKSQLNSHKMFANAFRKYCQLVDTARLYSTNTLAGPPKLIAWKHGDHKLLVDPEEIELLTNLSKLNPDAESIYELYPDPNPIFQPGSVWNDIVLSPSRPTRQQELRDAIRKIELKPNNI